MSLHLTPPLILLARQVAPNKQMPSQNTYLPPAPSLLRLEPFRPKASAPCVQPPAATDDHGQRHLRRLSVSPHRHRPLIADALPAGSLQWFDPDTEETFVYNLGDIAWVLTSTALVWLMIPGLGFFYSGLLRRKNALSMIWLSMMVLAVVSFQVRAPRFALADFY